jgi:hypothetical protein
MAKTYRLGFRSNAKDMARQYHWRQARVRMTLQAAAQVNGEILVRRAVALSSFTCHTLGDLRRMGYPYAVREPRPPHPPYMIHSQSGGFRSKWASRTRAQGDNIDVLLSNAARTKGRGLALMALLVDGTKTMIPRPIIAEVARQCADEMQLNNRRAYRAAVAGGNLHGAAARSKAGAYLRGLER